MLSTGSEDVNLQEHDSWLAAKQQMLWELHRQHDIPFRLPLRLCFLNTNGAEVNASRMEPMSIKELMSITKNAARSPFTPPYLTDHTAHGGAANKCDGSQHFGLCYFLGAGSDFHIEMASKASHSVPTVYMSWACN